MLKYFRLVLVLAIGFAMVGVAQGAPSKKHALVKIAKAVAAPVVHPKRTFAKTLGVVVFAVEAGNDVLLGALDGADKAASMEFKYNPFHYAALVDAKVDHYLEAVEALANGTSN